MTLNFKKERTQLATPGLFRTGICRLSKGSTKIEILRHEYKGKVHHMRDYFGITYDVCLQRGRSWDWARNIKLPQVKRIIKDANKFGLTNSF